ncbi:class I SAM-dependent methyltransferase [Streptomyces sp. 3214.6]|uniref:class I SAM-dependent methyltransferase n=1 Tax=Streptomyces sp. 3214.6 TaxID=1882757 RepID=UPI000909F5DC|nr:class I SAM-dependent methyltransferase [Streptomyces sp. 3214.6]SHH50782.1 Methyltransferase domain-containing protein [Streptomyces sp. 3214.6]
MTTDAQSTRSTGSLTKGHLSPLDQLRLFEKKYDAVSTGIIGRLPLAPIWRCLDLGAGAGSLSYWLAERVSEGSVLALDTDTGYLEPGRADNLSVRQEDLTAAEFPDGTFDLIIARAVLEHLREPEEALRRITRWLAPGGWLVAEDFYYLPAEHAPTPVGRALVGAYVRRMEAQGADMRWARGLPAALARAGLTDVDSKVTPAGPGQSAADDELIGTRLRQEGHTLVDSGLVTAEQLADFIDSLGTPRGQDMTTLLISAWGQRPLTD